MKNNFLLKLFVTINVRLSTSFALSRRNDASRFFNGETRNISLGLSIEPPMQYIITGNIDLIRSRTFLLKKIFYLYSDDLQRILISRQLLFDKAPNDPNASSLQ